MAHRHFEKRLVRPNVVGYLKIRFGSSITDLQMVTEGWHFQEFLP